MGKDKLKMLIGELKYLITELESEVYSDTAIYTEGPDHLPQYEQEGVEHE
tara:strand:+ start:3856 stop:4005 length:150 start_codon:yes stop_codon:yes gene_type:complete